MPNISIDIFQCYAFGQTMNKKDIYNYELTNHLGNVRATFYKGAGNTATLMSSSDYHPKGSYMPGRSFTMGSNYRFGYQGAFAEYDNETGFNHFDARLYNSRIGRWMTTDPAKQYWSPYMAMGNNWISKFDPDGKFVPWYLDKNTGCLHYSPTLYKTTPDNLVYIGSDDFFGKFGLNFIMDRSFTWSKGVSDMIANQSGMKIVPTKQLVYSESYKMLQPYGGNGEVLSYSNTESINLQYGITSFWNTSEISYHENYKKYGDPGRYFNRVDYIEYSYNKKSAIVKSINTIQPFIDLFLPGGIPSPTIESNFDTEYSGWSEYPSNGILNDYKFKY